MFPLVINHASLAKIQWSTGREIVHARVVQKALKPHNVYGYGSTTSDYSRFGHKIKPMLATEMILASESRVDEIAQ